MSTWLGFDEPDGMDDVASIQPEELYALLKKQDAHDRLLVLDVRQTDAINYHIVNAVNMPAQTFYYSRLALANLLRRSMPAQDVSPIRQPLYVVVHCRSGRSKRDRRCAAWLLQALAQQPGADSVKVCILDGGINGFAERYGEDGSVVYKLPAELASA